MEPAVLRGLENNRSRVFKYEDSKFQEKALGCIPLKRLSDAAMKSSKSENLTFHEHFLKAVMKWFKTEFFKWVDCKPCSRLGCNGPTRSSGYVQPTSDDIRYGASVVEKHECTVCRSFVLFPRYNDPSKLLETREGRCGEWANCFTGICRALGYDARFINDNTDHVWTEIYSHHLKRWIHCDACENAWDRPLVYEQGWKKKLSYIIAFSKDEVVDVTFKYTINRNDVKSRRVDEKSVVSKITEINNLFHHPPEFRKALNKRLAAELIATMIPVTVGDEVYEGRISGSAEWRQNRGEIGSNSSSVTLKCEASNEFSLKYNIVNEMCMITTDGNTQQKKGWKSIVFRANNIYKKIEYDWNMVYLARNSNEPSTIEWRIHCTKPIVNAKLNIAHETFESGVIRWFYGGVDETPVLKDFINAEDLNSKLKGCRNIKILAQLQGGCGDNAWQHTQLFRCNLSDSLVESFAIELQF